MLLPRIERYLRQTRMPPTRFGRETMNDPRLVPDLRNGRELRPKSERKIAAFLDAHEVRP